MNENFWGVKNATSLPELNEGSLVKNLKVRYHRAYERSDRSSSEPTDEGGSGIYTWTGTVLLAVNPYQQLNVYGSTQIEHHFSKTITQADPHPFGIASHAYCTLNKTRTAQSIVVSGESGAGKTETAKFVMRFLSAIGCKSGGSANSGSSSVTKSRSRLSFSRGDKSSSTTKSAGSSDTISNFLESTNPILEAFGNAKTCRNENSSRFGKIMKLYYSLPPGTPHHKLVSASVETYLLARSRVTHTPANERNYHIFYLLTNGGLEKHLPELKPLIRSAKEFSYLAGSASIGSGYLSDIAFLSQLMDALNCLGIDRGEQIKLFELVLGLLWLGNITIEQEDPKDPKCKVSEKSKKEVEVCAKIFGLSSDTTNDSVSLSKLLTEQKLNIGGSSNRSSSLWTPTHVNKAKTVRDAVVKRVYAKLFDHIVRLLNKKLQGEMEADMTATVDHTGGCALSSISILDIFGFENLPTNGLEQLCINYANERLQNFFLKNVVISEAEEYSRECISYPGVSPPDNGPVIRAIAGKGGIFDILKKTTIDSMLRPMDEYDAEFYQSLGSASVENENLQKIVKIQMIASGGVTTRRMSANPLNQMFTVCHYAEEVPYTVESFVDSNKDSDLRVDFILGHFRNDLLDQILETDRSAVPSASPVSNQQRRCIATTFAAQVDHLLVDHLEKTRLHCIRCIKPNDAKKANQFDQERVANQLRVSGMFEVLTLMAHAFPVRIGYLELFGRYKPLLSDKVLGELAGGAGRNDMALLNGTVKGTSVQLPPIHGAMAKLFVEQVIGLLIEGVPSLSISHSQLTLGQDFEFGTSKVFFRLGKVDPLENLLALCDADIGTAALVAELIGKRIMAKRRSRQLCFMRTCFKLLVVYRKRRNYWKWFRMYFLRISFLANVCRNVYLPRIKGNRLRKLICAKKIQRYFRSFLEQKRENNLCMIAGAVKSFISVKHLCGQSRLRFAMCERGDFLVSVIATFLAQKRLINMKSAERLAEMERLQVDMEFMAENHKEELVAQEARYAQKCEEIELVARVHSEELAKLKSETDERIATLSEDLGRRQFELAEMRDRICVLDREHASTLASMNAEFAKSEYALKTEIERIKNELVVSDENLQALVKSHGDELAAAQAHSTALESRLEQASHLLERNKELLNQTSLSHQEEIQRLVEDNRQAQVGFQKRLTECESELTTKINELLRESHRKENEFENLQRRFDLKEGELGESQKKVAQCLEDLDRMGVEHAQRICELTHSFDEKLIKELESTKNRMTAENNELKLQLDLSTTEYETLLSQERLNGSQLQLSLQALTSEHAEVLSEKRKLEFLLDSAVCDKSKLASQLEEVVKEKVKLASVANQALSQVEKIKKETEDQLKRDRAEMERKISSDSARIKRDLEIINKRVLEVKIFEAEEMKAEIQVRLAEAERLRNEAAVALEKQKGKTIVENSSENNTAHEVIQQAIRDYHSSTDHYEREYVIENRKQSNAKERELENAQRGALEAKLQQTAKFTVFPKIKQDSLDNLSNARPLLSPQRAPSPKVPRLLSPLNGSAKFN